MKISHEGTKDRGAKAPETKGIAPPASPLFLNPPSRLIHSPSATSPLRAFVPSCETLSRASPSPSTTR
jgi:hypothetical protein